MWVVSVGVAALNAADTGSTDASRPLVNVKPEGEFIQALAMTTNTAEAAPLRATGKPASQCCTGRKRSHPYRYRPRNMASRKKANPSAEKGRPMMLPLKAMKPGQSRPSSKESTVPDTAPIANRMPKAEDQRRASAIQVPSRRHKPMPSAVAMSSGTPTPRTANTIWKPSDVPMLARARVALSNDSRLRATPHAAQSMMFISRAAATASIFECTPSFVSKLLMCERTVA